MKKRCLSLLLALALIAGLGCAASVPASAESVFSETLILERLAGAEAIWPDGAVYVDGWDDGCSTCYGFVRELFRHVFNTALPTMWSTADARFTNGFGAVTELGHIDNYSVAQLNALLSAARPGDVLIATTGSGNHGVIVRSAAADGSGVWVYDANWSKNESGEPLLRSNAWWSAEEIQRTRPGAVTLYRYAGGVEYGAGYETGNDSYGAGTRTDFGFSLGTVLNPQQPAAEAPAGEIPAVDVPADAALPAPSYVSSIRQVYHPGEVIRFTWDSVDGATSYFVSLWKGGTELYGLDMGDNTAFTTASIAAGDYTLRVRAGNHAGYSADSAELLFIVTDEVSGLPAAIVPEEAGMPDEDETVSIPELSVPAAAPEAITTEVHFTRSGSYFPGQFADIFGTEWYAPNVASVYELGLMQGRDENMFDPDGLVTVLEAVIMASRIHSVYTTGTAVIGGTEGGPWYQGYLDYACQNGIIDRSAYESDVALVASRAQFASILAKALPPEALGAINEIAEGVIPDVNLLDDFASGVYALYRAGILTGGSGGAFSPGNNITRAEAAAIISRMAESDSRVEFTLE